MKTHTIPRKALSLILSLAFVFSMLVLPNFANAAYPDPVDITVTSATGEVGDEVTLSILFSESSEVGALTFDLTYDMTKLEYVKYAYGPINSANSFNPNFKTTDRKSVV